ncbi:hypothetical protein G7Y89_g13825 [Cudoniella acicularis]|uniref:amidase n=1 Tax=Cudoniella acicularis TaxID=354080 RepID=A0A8H4R6Q8_9HELO|nr:hypothetical protein G7Y89_g13825 [Cudoniella acicularis]
MATEAPWKAIAQRKQSEREARIPKAWRLSSLPPANNLDARTIPRTCGLLSSKELEITERYDATDLSEAIRSGNLTAEEVTIAFCKRAAIAQQVCNCLTEIFFDDAISRAKYLDQRYKETGKTLGPLHGVPVSLKDTFKVKGYDASIGIGSLADNPVKENSLLVDILLKQGAVLYCKTNIPQTLMALDSDNNLFGRVLNPRDRRLTAGGSSGGEGALIAMRGSVLGVGTDVGGSIRIPAMCNGLYGIKPSAQRVPYVGQTSASREGASKIGLPASAGPICSSLRDCELFLRAISDSRPWELDPNLAYGLWKDQGELEKRQLFGVIRTDGVTSPLPPINTILEETVQALRSSGVEVVEINSPAFKKCQSLANRFFNIDGGNFILDLIERNGEPLTDWLSTRIRRGAPIKLEKLLEIHVKKTEIETEMLKIWKDPKSGRRIDAIICPVAPHPVPPIDRWNGASYTSSFVLLDYPAGTLPVRDFKEADLQGELADSEPLGSWDKVNRQLWDKKTIDRKVYLNTKLSVQVLHPGNRKGGCTKPWRLLMTFCNEIIKLANPTYKPALEPARKKPKMRTVTTWALQVQFLLQIIINRVSILLTNRRKGRNLKIGVAVFITAINISVYNIWIPARLQISPSYVKLNDIWDRCEKIIYLIVDASLNYYFIRIIQKQLVNRGLSKYKKLVRFNMWIIGFSLTSSLPCFNLDINERNRYMQIHPLAYIVKLNIEMSMAELISKVAAATQPAGNGASNSNPANILSPNSNSFPDKSSRNRDTVMNMGNHATVTGNSGLYGQKKSEGTINPDGVLEWTPSDSPYSTSDIELSNRFPGSAPDSNNGLGCDEHG